MDLRGRIAEPGEHREMILAGDIDGGDRNPGGAEKTRIAVHHRVKQAGLLATGDEEAGGMPGRTRSTGFQRRYASACELRLALEAGLEERFDVVEATDADKAVEQPRRQPRVELGQSVDAITAAS